MTDSIYALASGGGRAGLAVYRLSGPRAGPALRALIAGPLPSPRLASLRRLQDSQGETIDRGLVLWFPGPASFTGEDVVELHLHGGRAVARAISDVLSSLGLRPAEPGEFSRRGFEAGKLDLTQAEAIADLVAADSAAQRRQALLQLDGALGQLYEDWRARLLRAQAHLEATIDFADQDLPDALIDGLRVVLAGLADAIEAHLADGGRGERLRDGLRVVLLGAPNAGKSSLLNCLSGREAAIVSEIAGTTRDVIETALDLGGYPLLLADTAGLRDSLNAIEQEGVRRAKACAADADLRLVLLDGALWPALDSTSLALLEGPSLLILNKADLISDSLPAMLCGHRLWPVSAQSGAGIDGLTQALIDWAERSLSVGAGPALTRARHRQALGEASSALRRALQETLPELMAEDVRVAARAIGRITGRVDVEAMLDLVFRDFCIGK